MSDLPPVQPAPAQPAPDQPTPRGSADRWAGTAGPFYAISAALVPCSLWIWAGMAAQDDAWRMFLVLFLLALLVFILARASIQRPASAEGAQTPPWRAADLIRWVCTA